MREINIELLDSKKGMPILKVDGYYLHSKYDPETEANRIVDMAFKEGYIHILFGFGLGYVAKKLFERSNHESKVILIDPLYNSIKGIEGINFPNNNFEIITTTNTVELINEISSEINNLDIEINVICSPNYDKLCAQEYKNILEIVNKVQNMNIVLKNTGNQFAYDWTQNFYHNLCHVCKGDNLAVLEKKYECPVIIVSGGPSLTKQLPILDSIKENCIILAAGSTINSLVNYGVEPHYVISIDGGRANYDHFKSLNTRNSKLIYAMISHHKIQDEFKNEKYAFISAGEYESAEKLTKDYKIVLPFINGGASVANFALSIAQYISTGPIALIGQDLAYTNNKSHAENNKFYKEISKEDIKNRGMFEVEGYNGQKVLTDFAFFTMKSQFETLITFVEDGRKIYNCTEGGVKLVGYSEIPFQQFVNKYIDKGKEITLNETKITNDCKDANELLKNNLSIDLKKLKLIQKHLLDIKMLLKDVEFKKEFKKTHLNKMDKADELINHHLKEINLGFISDKITVEIMNNFKKKESKTVEEEFFRVFSQNKFFYGELLQGIEFVISTINNLLSKVSVEEGN